MTRCLSALSLAASFVATCSLVRAAEALPVKGPVPEKPTARPERLYKGGPLVADLQTRAELSNADVAKIKEAVAAVEKRGEDIQAKPEVKAAEEELKKAQAAAHEAMAKLEAAREHFNLMAESRKAAYEAAPPDRRDAVGAFLKYRPKPEPKNEVSADKKEETPSAAKTPEAPPEAAKKEETHKAEPAK